MARVTGPLMSLSARGSIAGTLVFADWKGIDYARQHVIPANPNSSGQQLTRNVFSWLNNVFRYWPGAALDGWNAYAAVSRFTAANGFMKQNIGGLRSETDLANMIFNPASRGGIAAASVGLTPASTQITAAVTAPSLPTGWTITAAHGIAIRDQDPQTESLPQTEYETDASTPYSLVFTGLTDSVLYYVGVWFEFLRDDGLTAYGVSISDSDTPA